MVKGKAKKNNSHLGMQNYWRRKLRREFSENRSMCLARMIQTLQLLIYWPGTVRGKYNRILNTPLNYLQLLCDSLITFLHIFFKIKSISMLVYSHTQTFWALVLACWQIILKFRTGYWKNFFNGEQTCTIGTTFSQTATAFLVELLQR